MSLYFIRIFIALSLVFIGSYSQCMLNNIAKTHSIVRSNFKHLSLVNGAIAAETSVIRQLYDFGEIFPVYRTDKRNRMFIDKYDHPEKTHQMVRLIHTLFYRIPGTGGEACFGPTNQLRDDDPRTQVQAMATILALCEQMQGLEKQKNNVSLSGLSIDDPCKTEYSEHLNNIQNQFHALLKPQARLGAQMGHVVEHALQESNPKHKKCSYPPYMLQAVLLAFVYKKYSDDRNLLAFFYGELNNNLERRLLIPDINQMAWLQEAFKPVDQAIAFKKVQNILSANYLVRIFKNQTRIIEDNFESLIYHASQIRNFPTPVGYKTANYGYAANKKTASFPDCMETAMRNFINMCAYNQQTNQFDAQILQATFSGGKLHPTLIHYLNTLSDVNRASSEYAHNEWLNLISNIPFVAYHRMIDDIDGRSVIRTADKGYVAIPTINQNNELCNWLKDNQYQLSTPSQYGYELRPSIKNIIILLNHLLQLNLFIDDKQLAQEFMRSDFVKEYFPKLCSTLQAKGYVNVHSDDSKNIDIDALDCTDTTLYTTFYLPNITSVFSTHAGHGEFGLLAHAPSKGDEETKLKELLRTISQFPDQSHLKLFVTNFLNRQRIDSDYFRNNSDHTYINLFATPLDNTGIVSDLELIFHEMSPNVSLNTIVNIKNLLLRLAKKQPDTAVQDRMRLCTVTTFFRKLRNNKEYAGTDNTFAEIIELAQKEMLDGDFAVRYRALWLFRDFVEENQAFNEAVDAAKKGILDEHPAVRCQALELFQALVEKNQAFNEAVDAAKKSILDEDFCIERGALRLFLALFEKNQGFDEAIEIVQKGGMLGSYPGACDLNKFLKRKGKISK